MSDVWAPERSLCLVLGKWVSDEIFSFPVSGHGVGVATESNQWKFTSPRWTCDPHAELHGMHFQNEKAFQGESRSVPNKLLSSLENPLGQNDWQLPDRVALRPTLQVFPPAHPVL